nr:4-hydroxybenzoyl-CoA reductase subunit alpha-like [Nerophis lumbriciformis]
MPMDIKAPRKVDGNLKATGKAIYADDIVLPGMLHAKILRSPHAHARILSIDTSKAEALPGVKGVVVGARCPRVTASFLGRRMNKRSLKTKHVTSAMALRPWLRSTKTPAQERELVIHDYNPRQVEKKGNISKRVNLAFGDLDQAFADADVVVEGRWTEEPMQGGQKGILTLTSSTQVPHYLHRELAKVLELEQSQIRIVQPALGAGDENRPTVKLLYTREEVFYSHRGRHPMLMTFTTGATKDGKLTGVRSKILIDGALLRSKRGHGSVQPRFGFEVQLDELAERLEMDPIELRRANFIGEEVDTVNGQRITSNGFLQCLDAVEKASGWKERYGKLPRGRGLGIAGSMYISGTAYPIYPNEMPQSAVMVRVDRSGVIAVHCGGSDIGQGSDSMLQYIAAEELGAPLHAVRVFSSDTDLTPVDLGAYSSRGTFMIGNAAVQACRKMKAHIQEAVGEAWEVSAKEVELAGGFAMWTKDTSKSLPIVEAYHLAEAKFGSLATTGSYRTEKLGGDYRGGTIGASPGVLLHGTRRRSRGR